MISKMKSKYSKFMSLVYSNVTAINVCFYSHKIKEKLQNVISIACDVFITFIKY